MKTMKYTVTEYYSELDGHSREVYDGDSIEDAVTVAKTSAKVPNIAIQRLMQAPTRETIEIPDSDGQYITVDSYYA